MSRQLSPMHDWRSALAASDLPSMAKLVGGFGLGNYMSSRGTNAFPSLETLATDCSVAKSTVAEALRLLVDQGWLARSSGGGRGNRTTYEARIPAETVRSPDGSSGESGVEETSPKTTRGPLRAVTPDGDLRGRSTPETVVHTDGLQGREPSGSAAETVRLTAKNCPASGTELDQEVDHEAAAAITARLNGDAAAAGLAEDLKSINAGARLIEAAWRDPERARAWIALAREEANVNPAGFVNSGLASGEWPSPRGGFVSESKKQAWVDETSWKLDAEHAHSIVDEWDDIDDATRSFWHQAVDDAREGKQPGIQSEVA